MPRVQSQSFSQNNFCSEADRCISSKVAMYVEKNTKLRVLTFFYFAVTSPKTMLSCQLNKFSSHETDLHLEVVWRDS